MGFQLMNDNNMDITSEMDATVLYALGGYVRHFIIRNYKSNLSCTFSGLRATLYSGQAVLYGRFILHTENTYVTLKPNSTQYIAIRVDLSAPAENEVTLISTSNLKNDDLSSGGIIYDIPLYQVTTNSSSVTTKKDLRFSILSTGDTCGVIFQKSSLVGKLLDIRKNIIIDFDSLNNTIKNGISNLEKKLDTKINDVRKSVNSIILNNKLSQKNLDMIISQIKLNIQELTKKVGNISDRYVKRKVITASGNRNDILLSNSEITSLTGIKSTSDIKRLTILYCVNANNNTASAKIVAAMHLSNGWNIYYDNPPKKGSKVTVNYILEVMS